MFQFGAFCPIFRSHGSETPREIWEFPEYAGTLLKYDNLRYRLLPYIYSLGWQVTHDGYSIMRGLPMDFPSDRKTYSIDDQFLFGPAIMVSPVTEYMDHRPPEDSVLITSEHFKTKDGKPGLTARYYCDDEFKTLCHEAVEPDINLYWYTGWPAFITGPKFSMRWEGKLIPTETGKYRFHMKSFGPKRVFLDGKELPHNYDSMESYTVPVELEAGKEYDFAFETSNAVLGAFRAKLYWKTPEISRPREGCRARPKTRTVYLPAGTPWIDFWTGETLPAARASPPTRPSTRCRSWSGRGRSCRWVRSFSTPPRSRPIRSSYASIPAPTAASRCMRTRTTTTTTRRASTRRSLSTGMTPSASLAIDARQGTFPGMLKSRTFQVVVVGKGHGVGLDVTENADRVVAYQGEGQVVSFAR